MLSQRRELVKWRSLSTSSILRTLRLGLRYRWARLSGRSEAYPKRQGYKRMMRISSDRAQTTAEYGLIFALVLVAVVATMIAVGDAVVRLFSSVITAWPA